MFDRSAWKSSFDHPAVTHILTYFIAILYLSMKARWNDETDQKRVPEMSKEDTLSVLKNAEYGVMSTVGSDGIPYGVPMNYVFEGDWIFLHGAGEGHKIDNILANEDVCFSIVGEAVLAPERTTTLYNQS